MKKRFVWLLLGLWAACDTSALSSDEEGDLVPDTHVGGHGGGSLDGQSGGRGFGSGTDILPPPKPVAGVPTQVPTQPQPNPPAAAWQVALDDAAKVPANAGRVAPSLSPEAVRDAETFVKAAQGASPSERERLKWELVARPEIQRNPHSVRFVRGAKQAPFVMSGVTAENGNAPELLAAVEDFTWAGRDPNFPVTPIWKWSRRLEPHETITFQTWSLAGDPVTTLTVLRDIGTVDPTYSTMNDDCPNKQPLQSWFDSCLTFTNPTAAPMNIQIHVSSYFSHDGTATMNLISSVIGQLSWAGSYFGGRAVVEEAMFEGCAEIQGWANRIMGDVAQDPILLGFKRYYDSDFNGYVSEYAGAYDDYMNTNPQATVSLPSTDEFGYFVVGYADENRGLAGNVDVYFDQRLNVPDVDGDEIGSVMEGLLDSNDWQADSDFDGVPDYTEVRGLFGADFPSWGARPGYKDAFAEIHWRTPSEAIIPGNSFDVAASAYLNRKDDRQSVYWHFDVGINNPDPRSTVWGNWRDTKYIQSNAGLDPSLDAAKLGEFTYFCDDVAINKITLARRGYFRIVVKSKRGVAQVPGFCAQIDSTSGFAGVLTHELGHTLGLGHGLYAGPNYNSLYTSIMNYTYPTAINFSYGTLANTWDSLAAKETGWAQNLGQAQAAINGVLAARYMTNLATGGVDWNQDGVISPATSTVRARLNWKGEYGLSRARDFGSIDRSPTLAWMPATATLPAKFAIVTRRGTANEIAVTTATNLESDCSKAGTDYYVPECGTFAAPIRRNTSPTGMSAKNSALSAVGYVDSAGQKLIWFYLMYDAAGVAKIYRQTMSGSAIGSPVELPSSSGALSDPTAVLLNGKISVYATTANGLQEWTFTLSSKTWAGPVAQKWVNNGGTIRGYDKAATATVAYYDNASTPNIALLLNTGLKVAVVVRTGTTWTFVGERSDIVTPRRVGFAWVPWGPGQTRGRFYILAPNANKELTVWVSRNDSSGKNIWDVSEFLTGHTEYRDAIAANDIALSYTIGLDTNLRAAAVSSELNKPGLMRFYPLADGIVNQPLVTDRDDWTSMHPALPCARPGERTCWICIETDPITGECSGIQAP